MSIENCVNVCMYSEHVYIVLVLCITLLPLVNAFSFSFHFAASLLHFFCSSIFHFHSNSIDIMITGGKKVCHCIHIIQYMNDFLWRYSMEINFTVMQRVSSLWGGKCQNQYRTNKKNHHQQQHVEQLHIDWNRWINSHFRHNPHNGHVKSIDKFEYFHRILDSFISHVFFLFFLFPIFRLRKRHITRRNGVWKHELRIHSIHNTKWNGSMLHLTSISIHF